MMKCIGKKILSIVLVMFFCAVLFLPLRVEAATVVTYPGPGGVAASTKYSCRVNDGSTWKDSFMYRTAGNTSYGGPLDASFTNFEMSGGSVTVEVTKIGASSISSCVIRPKSLNITPTINGNKVTFTLSQPQKVEVTMDGDRTNVCFIFANAPDSGAPAGVTYSYTSGVYNVGKLILKSNESVYIKGGAYVKGSIAYEEGATNVSISGYGIISGENEVYAYPWGHDVVSLPKNSTCSGISIINNCGIFVYRAEDKTTTSNVKVICGPNNPNGTKNGGEGGMVAQSTTNTGAMTFSNCFVVAADDTYCLTYASDNSVVENCTAFTLQGGAFQLGWNALRDISNLKVEHCNVIRTGSETTAIASYLNGTEIEQHDILFNDIKVENGSPALGCLVRLQIGGSAYASSPDLSRLTNFTLKDIVCEPLPANVSQLQGQNEQRKLNNIIINNLRINGTTVTDSNKSSYFEINPYVSNLQIGSYSAPTPISNLLSNPCFESGTTGWAGYGSASITMVTSPVYEGSNSLRVYNRSSANTGVQKDIKAILDSNGTGMYQFRAVIKQKSAIAMPVEMGIELTDASGTTYYPLKSKDILTSEGKTQYAQFFQIKKLNWTGLSAARLIIMSKSTNLDEFYVDDCYMKKIDTLTSSPSPKLVGFTEKNDGGNQYLDLDGTIDWAHWGASSPTTFTHKRNITQLISDITLLGAGTKNRYSNDVATYKWTEGTPTVTGSSISGIYVQYLNNGYQFTVPADKSQRVLTVYAGAYGAKGKFEAILSDGSASPYVEYIDTPAGSTFKIFKIYYAAASANQTLTFKATVNTITQTFGNVSLSAAYLQYPGSQLGSRADDSYISPGGMRYSGSGWMSWNDSYMYCGTQHFTSTANDYVEFTFGGTYVKWIYTMDDISGFADVYIDGVYKTTLDLYSPAYASGQMLFSQVGLSTDSWHTIRIVCKGVKNANSSGYRVGLDYFEYGWQQ